MGIARFDFENRGPGNRIIIARHIYINSRRPEDVPVRVKSFNAARASVGYVPAECREARA